jgi:hypothetical protein
LQLRRRLGERFVDAFGGLDGRLRLESLLALRLKVVTQAGRADGEQSLDMPEC